MNRRHFHRTIYLIAFPIFILLALILLYSGAFAQDAAIPEGYHDGAEGNVDASDCNAFGWAVDPDDRTRNLQIQILADGNPVAWTTANQLREDVTACPEGTCGFSISLWGLVTAGEEHQITAQAYDEETGLWSDLGGTPKSLTCWGHPRGFHDYDSGDVPSWACNAGGWAMDPDDPERNLNIRILVDGNSIDGFVAENYREDLEIAWNESGGGCPGGTCAFEVSLWDLIDPYVTHEILVEAEDLETGDWYPLSNSSKTLTCRTYDIYAYNPLTGETKQITNLPKTDEYNPSWSPNGKQVAHDVVDLDGSQLGIYVTDVKTGINTPLEGAQDGGNDAAWSPNSKWIAFDRAWSDIPNLYIVAASGGDDTLVRENAVSADWAPNSKRLLFQDLTDGSIRTVPVDGGKGNETLIAPSGVNPSWSPDGNWIAYEKNGDIWKVPVNIQGTVLGDPIRVTGLIAGEGNPTWSLDSQTIVYHAGLSRDYDLWSVPAAGGVPTWLTGAVEFGDYDPAYARDSDKIAYASFSSDGQASRTWAAAFTYDLPSGYWEEGNHTFHFETSVAENTPDMSFEVSNELPLYQGSVLLRPWSIIANVFWGWDCTDIGTINRDQPTKFFVGWTTEGTYSEAIAYYEALNARVAWDSEAPVSLLQQETFPITSTVDWSKYACKSTNAPARILVQITEDWFVAQRFATDTELTYWIYESEGGELVTSGTMWSNSNGTADIGVGETWDLQPGNYLVISDGITTKDIVLENLIFEELDVNTGHVEGTAPGPFGRSVWIGIGFLGERWTTTSTPYGFWEAEFDQPVPWNYQWAAAQIFDTDGDISEVRPVEVTTRWMFLRVNYGHDWVESFYEPDHEVAITVTESDGITVKATANVRTEPKDFWNGDTGFQTQGQDWDPAPPDIRPYDWVYATVDNGITAQVQIGEINGEIDLVDDSVHGTVILPGFTGEVGIECHPWGSPEPVDMKFDNVSADGSDRYSCSWADEWDIQSRQDVGVGYIGPVGHWVANAIHTMVPHFRVFPEWEYIDGGDWPIGATVTAVIENKDCSTSGVANYRSGDPSTFISMGFPEGCDVEVGDVVTVTDGVTTLTHTVDVLAFTEFNIDANTVAGTAAIGEIVNILVHGIGTELLLTADEGSWLADFGAAGVDLDFGMCVRAEIRDVHDNSWSTVTAIERCILNPHFTVFPEWEFFDGNDWPDGVSVNISVEGKPECAITKVSEGNFFNGNFGEGCNLEISDTVTFTDGTTTRTHVVQNLVITDVNKDDNTISGTADAGAVVYVWPHDGWFEPRQVTAGEDGSWQVDLDDVGYDIQEGASGRSQIYDDAGNATAVDWYVPKPRFTVFPESEFFEGNDWPDGATVAISVEGKPGCYVEKVSWGFSFNGNFGEGCNLEIGDTATFTDGTTTRTHIVQNLAITDVDQDADTVAGTADVGAVVYAWVHGYGETNMELIVEDGTWLADFGSIPFDLVEGMCGRSEIRDEIGNTTAIDWCIPKPHFTVFPESEFFDGWDWLDGATIAINVLDKAECYVEKVSWDFSFNGNFGEGCNLEIGDTVTFTDGTTTRTHVVQNLVITDVNKDDNTISGTADAGAIVYVWPHDGWFEPRQVTAGEDGSWQVDLDDVGYDIQEGASGRSQIYDDAGNATAVDWYVPKPRFTVFPESEFFDGNDWPDGATVAISVEGKPECYVEKVSSDFFFNGNFGEGCNLEIGDTVTFTDGTTTRTHTAQNLAITDVNKDDNTISGTADPGAIVYVWPHDAWFEPLQVTANDQGNWQVDLDGVGYDIQEGASGRSQIYDDVGNATAVDWYIPKPRVVASITEDWFYLVDFLPEAALDLSIFDTLDGTLLWHDDLWTADVNGFLWINFADHGIDLQPGSYLVISDGNTTKELVIEGFDFEVFDLTNGHLQGTAPEPFGRRVWVGIGWENDGWSTDVTTDENGNWVADYYGGPVPDGYQWVAAQIFDADGDASELRPAVIIEP